MISVVKKYIESCHLLPSEAKVIVGLSGGADSVVLLYILRALGYACEAAHCNFHLRGDESNRDEQFVTDLCLSWGVTLHKTDFDTETYAHEHGISIEMAARDLRYAWFEDLRTTRFAEAIAVAHHQNDQAETLLLNLKRGTGLRGLGGMRPVNGHIVRPLLCVTRRQIESFCHEHELSFVTDSTNTDTSIQRNAIRAWLADASESDIRHMADTAQEMQAYRALLDALLLGQPIPPQANRTLLYELLAPYGFNASQADDILTSLPASGKRFETTDYLATLDHGTLTVSSIDSKNPRDSRDSRDARDSRDTRDARDSRDASPSTPPPLIIRNVRKRLAKEFYPAANEPFASFDADKLPQNLTLRHWQPGDYFYPITSGKPQKKKLQDFFSDLKLSLEDKQKIWLLTADETIVWVIGYRIDNRFKITDQTTQVAELSLEE